MLRGEDLWSVLAFQIHQRLHNSMTTVSRYIVVMDFMLSYIKYHLKTVEFTIGFGMRMSVMTRFLKYLGTRLE